MIDVIYRDFLELQHEQGMQLAESSDLLDLEPVQDPRAWYDGVPFAWIAKFYGTGMVKEPDGTIHEAHEFHVGIAFGADHLRQARPFELVTWLWPTHIWHPNVRPPFLCVGHITAGYELVPLLHQCFEIITYQNWATHDHLAGNEAVAEWARNHKHLFPLDRRPLKRLRPREEAVV